SIKNRCTPLEVPCDGEFEALFSLGAGERNWGTECYPVRRCQRRIVLCSLQSRRSLLSNQVRPSRRVPLRNLHPILQRCRLMRPPPRRSPPPAQPPLPT